MPLKSKLKTANIEALAPTAFYATAGTLLLVSLPFANYPPHIALTGIISLITAYCLFTKKTLTKWLITTLFFAATTLSLCTLAYVIFTNWLISATMIAYATLTWIFTARTLLKK
ncbi:MAG: hypothetical protein NWE94_01435 [Candidatus Bathyarchaeota archaeon]|nr:hypothetical protein [Candidatus Bathyarchaeota archaeon]